MRDGWGPDMSARLGWIIMEAPSPLGFAYVWFAYGGLNAGATSWLLFSLWQVHYIYRTPTFDPAVVVEHLSSRGNVLIRRAYADWGRYERYQSKLLELGVEMTFLPTYGVKDKNRTDTAIAVEAMEVLFLRKSIDTFVIVSGDSDFGVLARKLRAYGKRVIGISAKSSASKVLAALCHEFIFYETLTGEGLQGYNLADGEKLIRKVLPAIVESHTSFQPSLLKDRLRKLDSTFSERNYGFKSFLRFIESFPSLLKVQRFKGGHTQVTIVDGIDLEAPASKPVKSDRKPREERRESRRSDDGPRDEGPRDERRRGTGRNDERRREAGHNDERRREAGHNDERRERRPRREARAQSQPATNEQIESGAEQAAPRAKANAAAPAEQREQALGKALIALRSLMVAVVASYDEPISLRRLQNRMIESVPTFDHKKLGFARFIDFVREQDAVEVVKTGRTYRVQPK